VNQIETYEKTAPWKGGFSLSQDYLIAPVVMAGFVQFNWVDVEERGRAYMRTLAIVDGASQRSERIYDRCLNTHQRLNERSHDEYVL